MSAPELNASVEGDSLQDVVSSAPLPGDKAVKNGYELTVHFVTAKEVYYVKYREGANSDHWNEEACTYDGYCGNYRAPLERWREQTASAKCSRTTNAVLRDRP